MALPVNVNEHVFVLLPALEQAPDQMASRLSVTVAPAVAYDGYTAMNVQCYEWHGIRAAQLASTGDQLRTDKQAIEIISEASACQPELIVIPVERLSDDFLNLKTRHLTNMNSIEFALVLAASVVSGMLPAADAIPRAMAKPPSLPAVATDVLPGEGWVAGTYKLHGPAKIFTTWKRHRRQMATLAAGATFTLYPV